MGFLRKNAEEKGLALHVPEFGDFNLEQQPGGTLKRMHHLEGGRVERVIMFYEKMPSPEGGRIHLRLERCLDSSKQLDLDHLHVTLSYSRKDGIWHFAEWKPDSTIGRNIAPMEWENMMNEFLEDKHARKWLKEEETFGPPKKGILQHLKNFRLAEFAYNV